MYKQTDTFLSHLYHKRVAIFAFYSKKNIIDFEVIYYLKELRKYVDGIVFIADCELSKEEFNKISDLIIYSDCHRHKKYDFGSYSKGFQWLKQKDFFNEINEIIFCNDSVLGPYRPFSFLFEEAV